MPLAWTLYQVAGVAASAQTSPNWEIQVLSDNTLEKCRLPELSLDASMSERLDTHAQPIRVPLFSSHSHGGLPELDADAAVFRWGHPVFPCVRSQSAQPWPWLQSHL